MSTLADRLTLMGRNIQKRPLSGQEREEILKLTASKFLCLIFHLYIALNII